jgi:hypothetical protein
MRKYVITAAISLFALINSASAQSKGTKVWNGVKTGAKAVGNKTAELASKGKANVTDKPVKDKVGPNGEKIYVDDGSRYYFVDRKGRRHFISESALKNKKAS